MSSNRNIIIYTGTKGAKLISDALKEDTEFRARQIEQDHRKKMNTMHIGALLRKIDKVSISRYVKLCKLINSSDDEARNMAIKIIKSL